MVRVKAFKGAIFHQDQFQKELIDNIEHLQSIPKNRTFSTTKLLKEGGLIADSQPHFYLYRQKHHQHDSIGLLCEVPLQDYHQNKIRKHEKTLVRPHLTLQTYRQNHVGPVVLAHPDSEKISLLISSLASQHQPVRYWKTTDSRQHWLWRIPDTGNLASAMQEIDALYILDGHHRMQAAHKSYLLDGGKCLRLSWMQALIFSSKYVAVHPQHRILRNIPENIDILHQINRLSHIKVQEIAVCPKRANILSLLQEYEIVAKIGSQLLGLILKKASEVPLDQISAVRLQSQILSHVLEEIPLGRIDYHPGIVDISTLMDQKAVFFIRPPKVESIFEIADQNGIMPPKSTWIQPKPCSHMVIRL